MKAIKNFINDESGIETIEYAIIAAIVAAVALLIYGVGWGGSVQNTLKNAAAQSTTAVGSPARKGAQRAAKKLKFFATL
jgi:Flp pilus assembly pilin Flp